MNLDWDTAYLELSEELGRKPTNKEVRKKMHEDSQTPFKFPGNEDYEKPFEKENF